MVVLNIVEHMSNSAYNVSVVVDGIDDRIVYVVVLWNSMEDDALVL